MRRSPLVSLLIATFVGLLASACAREPLPQLLSVRDLGPREVELGDRLEVSGSGFAQGRPAHVHLHGVAERPGEDPEPLEVELVGDVITPERISIAVDEAVLGKLCGTGLHATHTTFEGAAEVLFAATTEGAPPVTGVLSHVTLDAYPTSTPRALLDARADEGARFLKSAGLRLRDGADSFVVESVASGSAADRAGVVAEDVIVAASGVRVTTRGDFAPPPSALSVPLALRRGGSEHEETHVVDLEASAAPLSSRLLVPALLVALAMLLVLFGASAPGRVVPWLRRRLHDGPRGSIVRALVPDARPIVRHALPALAVAATVAAPLASSGDAAALALAVVFSRVVAALTGDAKKRPVARALSALATGIPLLAITLGTVFLTGSRGAGELVAATANAPLSCAAFRSPIHLALATVALVHGIAPAIGQEATLLEDPTLVRRDRFLSAWEWLAAWVQCALVALLFFGGWRAGSAPLAAGGALFAVKTAALFTIAVALRSALGSASASSAARSALVRGVPLAIVLTAGARLWEEHVGARVVQMGAAVASIAIVVALALGVARPPMVTHRAGLDPFR